MTACSGPGPGCTATAPSAKFLGPGTTTPYIESTTGSQQFAAGGTLSLPAWSFQVQAGSSGTIQSTVSEFDTTADINLAGTNISVSLALYPAVTVPGCLATPPACTSQPAYQFQPLATTTVGNSTATTSSTSPATTTSGSATTTSGSATTTSGSATAAGTASTGGSDSSAVSPAGAASGGVPAAPTASASGTGTASPSGKLAFTGPPKVWWLILILGAVLLDVGYLVLSATWINRRRTRRRA